MGDLKEVSKTYRDGSRVLIHSDGVQRQMWVYAPGNDSDDADGTIWTNRHSQCIRWRMANFDETGMTHLLPGETKVTRMNDVRRRLLNIVKAGSQ